jgi:tartrate-resistant acid phosphatase type 5
MTEFVNSTQFLVLGDWGTSNHWSFSASEKMNGPPKAAVAAQMTKVYQANEEKSIPSNICVVSVGDNFYPSGVKSTEDKQWKTGFTDAYAGVKCDWYSVLGNHDWESNPQAQIEFKADPRWHMDSYYFTKIINNVEFIFIDTPTLCPEHTRSILSCMSKNRVLLTDEARDKQMVWLEATLKASTSDWIVVVGERSLSLLSLYVHQI